MAGCWDEPGLGEEGGVKESLQGSLLVSFGGISRFSVLCVVNGVHQCPDFAYLCYENEDTVCKCLQ